MARVVRGGRKKAGLTQENLVECSGISLRYLQEIEAGTANASLLIIAQLSEALSIPGARFLSPDPD